MGLRDTGWHERALCNGHPDPDLWHYENSVFEDEQKLQVLRSVEAIQICRKCPVIEECFKQGIESDNMQYTGGASSIWGGMLMTQRYLLSVKNPSNRKLISESRHLRDVRRLLAIISK